MKHSRAFLLAGLVLTAAFSSGAVAQRSPSAVEVVAEYPNGSFLENLDVLKDGSIVFTNYFAKTVEIIEAGKVRTFATLSAHPVSILATQSGFVVAAHGAPFVSGPGFVETQQILILDQQGRETGGFKAPDARFLNGMTMHTNGSVLVADSIAATIWRVDLTAGTMSRWLSNEALSQMPGATEFRPGANGLKRAGERLIISNSSRGTLSTIAIAADGAHSGDLSVLAQVGPIDDFAIAPNGEIIFTTHGPTLKRRAIDGAVSTLLENGCDGCTAVAITGSGAERSLIVLTTGGLSEGGKMPARVLRLPYAP